jgi:glutathione synthase/RimK-type ligase-like ATP-grasp enzyme
MSKKVAIITQPWDFHADMVILHLRSLGHEPVRIHSEDFPLTADFTMHFSNEKCAGSIRTSKRRIGLEELRSIWWRRPGKHNLTPGLTEREHAFAAKEVTHAFQGLWSITDCYWMSYPGYIREAEKKPGQLKRAVQCGFEIPRTLITSEPEAALEFFHAVGGRMIYKVLSDPTLCAGVDKANTSNVDNVTYCTLLDETKLRANLHRIRNTTCQFQEYVEKRSEFRVTVIGDRVFAAEIDSQANERTRVDWRHYDVPMIIRKATLPRDIEQKCLRLVRSYGLNFSTMDLIHTPDGRYVFLENNANGQWAFVQQLIPELKMVDAVAECLLDGAPSLNPSLPIAPILAE